MRKAIAIALVVALAANCAGGLLANAPIAPELPRPLYSRQWVFSIPFQVEQPSAEGIQPRGVQLHVSADQGQTWRVAQQVEPKAERFTFRADRDGEYWFFVRTIDERGQLQPVGPPAVELRVIVDTLPPRLKLHTQIGEGGEITATWQLLDQNLKPDSFHLEFQPLGANAWQTVNVPRSATTGQRVVDGQITWWPGTSTGKIRVRATVADLAGNPAASQFDLDLDRRLVAEPDTTAAARSPSAQPQRNGVPGIPSGWSPGATGPQSPGASPGQENQWQPDHSAREPFRPGAWDPNQSEAGADGSQLASGPSVEEVPAPPPIEEVAVGERTDDADLADDGSRRDRTPAPRRQRPVSTGAGSRAWDGTSGMDDSAWNEAETLPPGQETSDEGLSELGDPRRALRPAAGDEALEYGGVALPPGETAKFVNSLRFALEYDVESVGPAGIGRVELWGTRDGGRTWETFGIDPDNRSPFVVTVEEEGLYGFQIVVESGTGLGGLPPKNGDPAEVWIAVDLTRPEVELLGIDQGADDRAGELVIRWEAADELLGPRPISLAYRDARGGEWATFASGLQNSGRHLWQIDRRVPEQIYLRVEVRDAAGNVAVADSFEPISLDRVRPQGRIRDVRPAPNPTQGARGERTLWR